jgi:hypothetical protein
VLLAGAATMVVSVAELIVVSVASGVNADDVISTHDATTWRADVLLLTSSTASFVAAKINI